MKNSSGSGYAETYKKRENRQLQKRLKKTRSSLIICSIIFVAGGILFMFMSGKNSITSYALHFIVALVFLVLAANSRKKPFMVILTGMLIVGILWILAMALKNPEVLLRESLLNIFALSVLALALGTAREAEIIKKELYLS